MRVALLMITMGCAAGAPRADAPAGSASVDATLTCTGAGGSSWTASFGKSAIDECVYRSKDNVLDLRVGTLEQGVTVHLVDFNGTGQYSIAGASGSKLAVVAAGGSGEATSTRVDTTADDPCKASCSVDVPEATVTKGEGTLSIEISCTALTRNADGACTKCVPKAKTLVRATSVACRHE